MNRMKHMSRGFAAQLIIACAFALFAQHTVRAQKGTAAPSPQPSPQPVNTVVVNTAANPVPVVQQGTASVNVVNTPSVKAQQSGAWEVGISPTANTVKLDTTAPLPVRNVDNPAPEPFQFSFSCQLTNEPPNPSFCSPDPVTVPAGKRLVIEFVSIYGLIYSSNILLMNVTVQAASTGATHFFVMTPVDPAADLPRYTLNQQTRLYADAGTQVEIRFDTKPPVDYVPGGTRVVKGGISGYLVNLP